MLSRTAIHAPQSFGAVLLVFCFGLGLYAVFASIAPAIMSELFPTELRGLGIGAWYNLTVAIFAERMGSGVNPDADWGVAVSRLIYG